MPSLLIKATDDNHLKKSKKNILNVILADTLDQEGIQYANEF
jgi:hypothetical protein